MLNKPSVKVALVLVLVAAAFAGPPSGVNWKAFAPLTGFSTPILGLLAFGIFNALVSPSGTMWLRAVTIAAVIAALLRPNDGVAALILVLAWVVWPPAFMVSWTLAREAADAAPETPLEQQAAARRARLTLAGVIAAVAIASVAYRLLVAGGLQQTAALFIGLPGLLAILVVVASSPRSAIGVAIKAVTVSLLVSAMFLWEGALCIVFAAPLFYSVAVVIAGLLEWARRRQDTAARTVYSCLIVLAAAPMSLEGVTDLTTIDRDESVVASKIVHASSADISRALFEPPRFERGRPRPLFLRAGFPTPTTSRVERIGDRTQWVVQLRGGEMLLTGMEARTGDLVLDLEDARPGLVRWRVVSDTSHTTHFLAFRESIVRWEPIDAQTTRVTWTLRYDRGLDPAWYFGPMERYATRLAAGYLIDAVATP
jgi:hypothetical protein